MDASGDGMGGFPTVEAGPAIYRRPLRCDLVHVASIVGAFPLTAAGMALVVRHEPMEALSRLLGFGAGAVVVGAGRLALLRRERTEVSPQGIRIVTRRPERFVRWAEIADIRESKALGCRNLVTYGRHGVVRLPAPTDAWPARDRDYETRRDDILRSWQNHRIPTPLPAPPPLAAKG